MEGIEQLSINYIEFNVTDIKRSQIFYGQLGWSFIDYGEQYCEFNAGSLKGGFYQTDKVNAKGGALIILFSQHLEQALEIVKKAGGTITQGIYSFPGGKRFHFEDLDGYELAVWSD